jgi:hypothetical protein
MLQRKQTLWALLAVICAALTFKFSFYSGNMTVGPNGHVFMHVKALPTFGLGKDSASSGSVLILIVTVLILAGTLINIFNFKARKNQLRITFGLFFLSVINLFLYWRASGTPPFTEGSYNLGALFSVAIPIFLILAARGIARDEKLVKSTDRLR